MDLIPVKNELMHRFELIIDGKIAFLEYQHQSPEVLAFTHTFVPTELRGRNLAAILTKYALEDARQQGKKVAPMCSYVDVVMQRNKEFNLLRASSTVL